MVGPLSSLWRRHEGCVCVHFCTFEYLISPAHCLRPWCWAPRSKTFHLEEQLTCIWTLKKICWFQLFRRPLIRKMEFQLRAIGPFVTTVPYKCSQLLSSESCVFWTQPIGCHLINVWVLSLSSYLRSVDKSSNSINNMVVCVKSTWFFTFYLHALRMYTRIYSSFFFTLNSTELSQW